MYLKPIFINATSLSDAWFQTLYKCIEVGRDFKIDKGSFEGQKRLEFDFATIHITMPDKGELLPKVNPQLGFPDPVAEDYLNDYLPYLMTDAEKDGESYTYGQRICKEKLPNKVVNWDSIENKNIFIQDKEIWKGLYKKSGSVFTQNSKYVSDATYFINQMKLMIYTYKNKGYRNNQMIMQVGQPSDMILKDPPCLRHIDTRIQDGKLHFFPYFRSWDLWGGFPANLAAIELMKQYCAEQIGVGNGEIIASSKGLHIYDYVWELAESIRGKTIEEFRNEFSL